VHRSRDVAQTIQERWQKQVSLSSLRRLLGENGLSYKRIRRSCRHLRDELAYEFFKTELAALRDWAGSGEIDLCYGDEMGVSHQAVVPYGWQPKGKSEAFVPATPGGNLTTLGIFYEDNRLESYLLSGGMTSEAMITCLTDFASRLTKRTVLILDNASSHTSELFRSHLADWRSQGLLIQYIPAYCPELNRIECLWKHIKYHWLKPNDFLTASSLRNALVDILSKVGTKYRISFS
jgi:transposase